MTAYISHHVVLETRDQTAITHKCYRQNSENSNNGKRFETIPVFVSQHREILAGNQADLIDNKLLCKYTTILLQCDQVDMFGYEMLIL